MRKNRWCGKANFMLLGGEAFVILNRKASIFGYPRFIPLWQLANFRRGRKSGPGLFLEKKESFSF
jgi:hypothetical protein